MAVSSFRLVDMPYFLQREDPGSTTPIVYSARNFRLYTATLSKRSGPLGPGYLRVTQSDTVGWSVKVKTGFAHVSGFYMVYLAADTDIPVPAAWKPPSGTRAHKVYLAVYDEIVTGSDCYGEIQIVQDEGFGVTPPADAASYIELATITVSSTQSNIQDANIVNRLRHGGNAHEKISMAPYLRSTYQAAAGDGHAGPYMQYDTGLIRLSGRIQATQNFTSGSASENKDLILADLPPEYRPAATRSLVGTMSKNLSGGSSLYFYRLEMLADGKLVARIPTGQTVEYLTFDNMQYWIDPT